MKNSKQTMQGIAHEAAESCLGFGVRKAGRAITQAYDRAFESVGITGSQYSILNALFLLQQPGMSQLAESLATDRTTLTRNLRLLEGQGLVENNPGKDRRTRLISLTAAGTERLQDAQKKWKAINDKLTEAYGRDAAATLLSDLGRLTALLE